MVLGSPDNGVPVLRSDEARRRRLVMPLFISVLVALLALFIDWVGRVVEHVARPKGL